ncbi:CBL-interacting serine/threonine-protein kinase 7 [Rosa chinensis]|nr:CBL-interacting serine/threonine-protein kinase 7 [Rosa chinensis]
MALLFVSALCFCHENGFGHRNVKPQNLLLEGTGNLKVSDFEPSDLPKQLKDGLLHTACRTPEVLYRVGCDRSKADAWSCGVILSVFLAHDADSLSPPSPPGSATIAVFMLSAARLVAEEKGER